MEAYLEKNKDTLSKAIADLPGYTPPANIWMAIDASLERQESIQTALHNLPQHRPPTVVWDQIEQQLDAAKPQKRPFTYRMLRGARPWIAAATLCGLALGTWWYLEAEPPAITTIAYSEEVQMQASFAADWNDEEEQIAFVIQKAERSPVADPQEVKRLKSEYNELTDARAEVEDMLNRYGEDESLLKEVARIERQRSQVIRELATWI